MLLKGLVELQLVTVDLSTATTSSQDNVVSTAIPSSANAIGLANADSEEF
jgi:hypothetical protein